MKILVVHPEDELQGQPWASMRWDLVIDLGNAGAGSYGKAAAHFGCRISRIRDLGDSSTLMRRVRELFGLGLGRLTDSQGLDWWELTAILVHQKLEVAVLLHKLVGTLSPTDELHVTRHCFQAEALKWELGSNVHMFPSPGNSDKRSAGHYFRLLKRFPLPQLMEIFWDKTDPGYQFRGYFRGRGQRSSSPTVLLPSSYINVSRTALDYAESVPESRFLLVVTRRSGWIDSLPPNVSVAWLSQYALVRVPSRKLEYRDLMRRWEPLRDELNSVAEIKMLEALGCFDEFPNRFVRGLEIRDAWRNVLDQEAVQGVLCADDSNPYTHIPLILAEQRGLPTIACHHGALDGRYLFKRRHADVLLAKGKMEEDYLVRLCEIPTESVEVGAAPDPVKLEQRTSTQDRRSIVFFSEPYEMAGGRGKGFYQDILPSLADLALSEGRELIVKLHPSESVAERSRLVRDVLSAEQQRIARIVSGAVTPEMLAQSWFGITVMSTAVVDC